MDHLVLQTAVRTSHVQSQTVLDDYIQQAAWPQVRKTTTTFALPLADGFFE